MRQTVERIEHGGDLLAMIVRSEFDSPGITFFTSAEAGQQLGYMHHPAGKLIAPHVHRRISHQVPYAQEVLLIRRGRLRADFYAKDTTYVGSRELGPGDVIALVAGGHGFEVLEEVEMFEVKQGPYMGDAYKTRFTGISADQAVVS